MLIEHNADVDIRGRYGMVTLHLAARSDEESYYVDIMQLLLDHGANPNARDEDGSTPLHSSCWWEKEDCLPSQGTVEGTRLLLEHGAIIDAEDNKGRTPLQLARRHDIAACLLEHGATR
jgi:serine/threonine-protein kinase TNNI3K